MPELDVLVPEERQQKTPHTQRKSHRSVTPATRPERRSDKRNKGPRQVWIQATDANGAMIEEIQIMRDYSRGGFYFVSSLHCYFVGMRLNVIPSFGSLNLEFVAEVVRVEPKPKMAYGIGVKLLHARDPIPAHTSAKA